MYQRPYNVEEIKQNFSKEMVDKLLSDPVHLWRATMGIELIHKEPSIEEQKRIWNNWLEMTDEQKKISDAKSQEFFGINNTEHHQEIMYNA